MSALFKLIMFVFLVLCIGKWVFFSDDHSVQNINAEKSTAAPAPLVDYSSAPALAEMSYSELKDALRDEESQCDKIFGNNDGLINDKQRQCYQERKSKYTDACYEKDELAKRDCAQAGNINECLHIKHPNAWANIAVSGCSGL